METQKLNAELLDVKPVPAETKLLIQLELHENHGLCNIKWDIAPLYCLSSKTCVTLWKDGKKYSDGKKISKHKGSLEFEKCHWGSGWQARFVDFDYYKNDYVAILITPTTK